MLIQQVLILKFAVGPEKFPGPGLSRNGPLLTAGRVMNFFLFKRQSFIMKNSAMGEHTGQV